MTRTPALGRGDGQKGARLSSPAKQGEKHASSRRSDSPRRHGRDRWSRCRVDRPRCERWRQARQTPPQRLPVGHRDRRAPDRGQQHQLRLLAASKRQADRCSRNRRATPATAITATKRTSRIAAELGFNAHRFGIEWARIEPEPGQFCEAELDHYRRVLEACHARSLAPIVTFNHLTVPRWFATRGGFEHGGQRRPVRALLRTRDARKFGDADRTSPRPSTKPTSCACAWCCRASPAKLAEPLMRGR